jgi:hypothetical protein
VVANSKLKSFTNFKKYKRTKIDSGEVILLLLFLKEKEKNYEIRTKKGIMQILSRLSWAR